MFGRGPSSGWCGCADRARAGACGRPARCRCRHDERTAHQHEQPPTHDPQHRSSPGASGRRGARSLRGTGVVRQRNRRNGESPRRLSLVTAVVGGRRPPVLEVVAVGDDERAAPDEAEPFHRPDEPRVLVRRLAVRVPREVAVERDAPRVVGEHRRRVAVHELRREAACVGLDQPAEPTAFERRHRVAELGDERPVARDPAEQRHADRDDVRPHPRGVDVQVAGTSRRGSRRELPEQRLDHHRRQHRVAGAEDTASRPARAPGRGGRSRDRRGAAGAAALGARPTSPIRRHAAAAAGSARGARRSSRPSPSRPAAPPRPPARREGRRRSGCARRLRTPTRRRVPDRGAPPTWRPARPGRPPAPRRSPDPAAAGTRRTTGATRPPRRSAGRMAASDDRRARRPTTTTSSSTRCLRPPTSGGRSTGGRRPPG